MSRESLVSMAFQAPQGTKDLLGDAVTRWASVERTVRRLAGLYGYQELRTPLIEDASLFLRSVGETTDIVQKEMFRFEDRGGHDIALRPEGTASVVRAYLEHNLHKTEGFAKLLYLGPMFRAERPQAGRFRQFHQYGVEAIGSESPWVDVEVITLCLHILRECGLMGAVMWLSSMGCRDDQQRSAQLLRERLMKDKPKLCKECQIRFEKNVFRVLDCKNPTCHEIAWRSKASPFVLCEACAAHFDEVRRGLREAGVSFDDTKVFARGLDYYTRTVFEVRATGLGAQDAVAAGGRYDHLVEELGGPPMGAFGFAAGIERVLMAAEKQQGAGDAVPKRRGLYLAIAQPPLVGEGFRFVQQLRARGVSAVMDYDGKSLKAQLREADKANCQLVAILGEAEVKQRVMTLKDLAQGTQRAIPLDAFVEEVSRVMG
ncbi:MAG: histidine--tRNA ligase [Candidatus Omnitrophica bacterium]|nr:histidine--tRNA ligase [Candidatus Omnitrophota bacterium]